MFERSNPKLWLSQQRISLKCDGVCRCLVRNFCIDKSAREILQKKIQPTLKPNVLEVG